MKRTFLFVDECKKNVVGVLEALKNEPLEAGTRIYIDSALAKCLAETADKICDFQVIQEILWKGKYNTMGFLDLGESNGVWNRVYRINSGKTVFIEKPSIPTSQLIYIS